MLIAYWIETRLRTRMAGDVTTAWVPLRNLCLCITPYSYQVVIRVGVSLQAPKIRLYNLNVPRCPSHTTIE